MQLQQKDTGDDRDRYLSSAGGIGDTWTHKKKNLQETKPNFV